MAEVYQFPTRATAAHVPQNANEVQSATEAASARLAVEIARMREFIKELDSIGSRRDLMVSARACSARLLEAMDRSGWSVRGRSIEEVERLAQGVISMFADATALVTLMAVVDDLPPTPGAA